MNISLSDKTQKGRKIAYRLPQVTADKETKLFQIYLQKKHNVNMSEFIRELLKFTAEWQEYRQIALNNPEEIKKLEKYLPKPKRNG